MTPPRPRPITFVTGGCGFIGSALCRRLAAEGHEVVTYDDLSRGKPENLPDGVRLIRGDIRDRSEVEAAVTESRADTVIHLAALHYLPDCAARPQETIDVNVEGTRHVLDACRKGQVNRVVFASSVAVYAATDTPCSEDRTPLEPVEVYGMSKLEGERLMERLSHDTSIAATCIRIANAVGRSETNPHVVPHIFESLQTADEVTLGNIAPRRDYIDTRDIADAIVAVLTASNGYQVFNVGTGSAHAVSDIVAAISRIIGRPLEIRQDVSRFRPVERMQLVADIDKIRRVTGWAPRFSLDETLRDLVDAYGLGSPRWADPESAHPKRTPTP